MEAARFSVEAPATSSPRGPVTVPTLVRAPAVPGAHRIEVRAMRDSDIPAVLALVRPISEAAFLEWEDAPLLRRHLATNGPFTFVAECGGALVGAIIAGSVGVRGTISHVATAPAYRRRGVASALVCQTIAGFRAYGLRRIFLFTQDRNGPARRFWARCGFAETSAESTWETDL